MIRRPASHKINKGFAPDPADVHQLVTEACTITDNDGNWIAEYRPAAVADAFAAIVLSEQDSNYAPGSHLPGFEPLVDAVGLGPARWMTFSNNPHPTPYHQDLWENATDEWVTAIAVHRGGNYDGFVFVLGEYGLGFDFQHGDLLIYDHRLWHGNTAPSGDVERWITVMAFDHRP